MARTLAVLGQALHSLVNESDVLLVYIETQQTQAPRGAAAYTIKELQRLAHQVVVVFVVLTAKEVLGKSEENSSKGHEGHASVFISHIRAFCVTLTLFVEMVREAEYV